MSAAKISILVLYGVLGAVALTQANTTPGSAALWILLLLAGAHLVEVMVFLPLARRAGGSLVGHMLQVFLFGIFHKREMETSAARE
jgi:uncharacterized protein YhhL (DUF1145 family)